MDLWHGADGGRVDTCLLVWVTHTKADGDTRYGATAAMVAMVATQDGVTDTTRICNCS